MKIKKIKSEFEVGDYVFILEPGSCYPYYYTFLKHRRPMFTDGREYLSGFSMGAKTPIKKRLEVVDYGYHEEVNRLIYVLRYRNSKTGRISYFLDGLKNTRIF